MTSRPRASGDRLSGVLYALVAHGCWGVMPVYFAAMKQVPATEILAHRIAWSSLFLVLLLAVARRWGEWLACVRDTAKRNALLLSSVLIAVNWFVYTYSVIENRVTESSLGYFINPLLNVVLGVIVFGERFRPGQGVAIALAVVGVILMICATGDFPWISITLAVSFGLYGMVRKAVPVDGVLGLAVETLLLAPLAVGYLAFLAWHHTLVFGTTDRTIDWLLISTGIVTTIPLVCFGQAARRLNLATLGFIQYLAPTVQFILAVYVLGEAVQPLRWLGFTFIWTALAVYTIESVRGIRGRWSKMEVESNGNANELADAIR